MRDGALTAPAIAMLAVLTAPGPATAREPGDPIRLTWTEGDVAGMSTIYGPEGDAAIGFVDYHQTVRGDVLSSVRIARFQDGSSDEDWAEARLGGDRLVALGGRSIVRDRDGEPLADVQIDVAAGRIVARWGRDGERRESDQRLALPPGTYWGPLIFLVLKNFEANAEDGRLLFRTVAPTPRPYMLDMEIERADRVALARAGTQLATVRFDLRPRIHWTIDPLIRLAIAPASFFILPGDPPGLVRFTGPRNYQRQAITIQ
jgi:hypothetical protein